MDLETRNSQLQEELSSAPTKRPSASSLDWLPRAPARYALSGHRSPITRVTFHPLFSLVVSASEDASLKVWDWETGEFERTVKGHTKAVQDVDFDSKGNYLGEWGSREKNERALWRIQRGAELMELVAQFHAHQTSRSRSGTPTTTGRTSRRSTAMITPSRLLDISRATTLS